MKKSQILILIVVIAVVVIGVVLLVPKNKQSKETAQSTGLNEESATPATSEETNLPNQEFSNVSYRCTYTAEGGLQFTTYAKGKNMRTEVKMSDGDTNVSLYTNDKVYQWSEATKQGIVMAVEAAKGQSGTEVQDPEEYLEEMRQKYNPDCKNMDLVDSLFVVPKDIEFQDVSQLLNQ